MSELTKVLNTIHSLDKSIELLLNEANEYDIASQINYQKVTLSFNTLKSIKKQVDDIIPKVEKFRLKSDAKDPISGVNLYGPSYFTKLTILEEKLSQLGAIISSLYDRFEHKSNLIPQGNSDPVDPAHKSHNTTIVVTEAIHTQPKEEPPLSEEEYQRQEESKRALEYQHQLAEESRAKRARESELYTLYITEVILTTSPTYISALTYHLYVLLLQVLQLLHHTIESLNTRPKGVNELPTIVNYIVSPTLASHPYTYTYYILTLT